MPKYTIETTYHLPVFRYQTIEARTIEEACRLAIEDDDWNLGRMDFETSGEVYVTGVWHGSEAAYHGPAVPVPVHFEEAVQRKADHFAELLKQLEYVAQPLGVSVTDFERWLTGACAAVEKAHAIIEDRRDPHDPAI